MNRWTNPDDPYLQFLYAADGAAKNQAFQNIFRGLVDQKAPAGSGARNAWEYLQSTMRKIGHKETLYRGPYLTGKHTVLS